MHEDQHKVAEGGGAIRVLVIEDNRGDVVLLQEAFERAGLEYGLEVVDDGVKATEYLERRRGDALAVMPQLILLDLRMPRKGGREVLAEIRGDPVVSRIPVVILSSSASELALTAATLRTCERCMTKPATFEGYVDLVQRIEAFRRHCLAATPGGQHGH